MAEAPSAKRRKFTSNVTVELVVGQRSRKTSFFAFKDHICDVSSFSSRAFRGGFAESKGVLLLSEDKPATVEAFLEWMLTRQYEGMDKKAVLETETAKEENYQLVELYVFADKTNCQELKRQIIRYLSNMARGNGPGYFIPGLASVLERLPAYSGLRKLCVALHVWIRDFEPAKSCNFAEFRDAALRCPELGAEMLVETLTRFRGGRESPFQGQGKPEDFFEPCMLKKK